MPRHCGICCLPYYKAVIIIALFLHFDKYFVAELANLLKYGERIFVKYAYFTIFKRNFKTVQALTVLAF